MEKITVPNDVFFAHLIDMLGEGSEVKFTVKGHSMFPFMRNEKDMVSLKSCDSENLHKGDVVLFRFNGKYIMHRIIRITQDAKGGRLYVIKGDGNCYGEETAAPENVFGVMTKRITPSGKEWRCSSFSWRFLSRVWVFLSPFRRILLGVLRRIYR